MTLTRGTLLLASPLYKSGIFDRSVILLCEHSRAGAFGLMVNKPMRQYPEGLTLDNYANRNLQFLVGGPLNHHQLLLVHESTNPSILRLPIKDGVCMGGDLDFLQSIAAMPDGPTLLLCFGYCGWSSGQLEKEMENGYWMIANRSTRTIFQKRKSLLWRNLMMASGKETSHLAYVPGKIELN